MVMLDEINKYIISKDVSLSMVVYVAINNTNNKIYIGHTTTSLYRRKISHKSRLKKKRIIFSQCFRKIWF